MDNRPRGREKNVSGQGKDIYRRGPGLGTGPVGNSGGYSGRGSSGRGSGGGKRSGGGLPIIVVILLLLFGGGKIGLGNLSGGSSNTAPSYTQQPSYSYTQPQTQTQLQTQTQSTPSYSQNYGSLFSGLNSGSVSSGWNQSANVSSLDSSVASGARAKYTTLKGGGKDTVTIMVYMCGTDLESRSGMATSDIKEMAGASIADNVNIIVYTGGCTSWKNNIFSNRVNQIYKVENGGVKCLVSDAGSVCMTKPDTLASFIKWCGDNYPANRNELILWDHGGGSLSGYGYDEKYKSSGSMTLQGINSALKAAGMKFDFIGFDACLMATLENALMLTPYADYLIASEETEPGVGWYYTNWISALSKNTSISTLDMGRKIIDDYTDYCAQRTRGQKTTLSIVDLAELEHTAPAKLKDFAKSTSELLKDNEYTTVSRARSSTREFASSTRIDQVDLVHLAYNIGTDEAKALANTLRSAVKYNRTSSNMTNAYGLSIYFPYQKTSKVDTAVRAYEAIGMDSDYARCIQEFASIEVSGQAASGGASSPLPSLYGFPGGYSGNGSAYGSGSSYGGSGGDYDMLSQLLTGMLTGNFGNVSGLSSANSAFLGRSLEPERTAQFIADNHFDPESLVWLNDNGRRVMYLSEDQWSLVQELELNVFFDDGSGYIDLGLDNVFDFTDDGALVGSFDGTWLAINDQPVAYYHTDTFDDGTNYTITGRVPVILNGVRAELILVFDNKHPYGFIAGACTDYHDGETETVAKNMTELEDGDVIDFICDYYGYDGSYQDSYLLGDRMVIDGEPVISNVYINASAANACYRFTDIYCQQYWTPVMN